MNSRNFDQKVEWFSQGPSKYEVKVLKKNYKGNS
jgi:hypothetical protein